MSVTIYIHRVQWCPAEYYLTEANRRLLASFAEVRDHGDDPSSPTHEELVAHLRGADGILLHNASHAKDITRAALEEAGGTVRAIATGHWWPQMEEMIRQIEGSGVRVIDASDACNQAVAEWALGALICGLRRCDVFDRELKAGGWPSWRGTAGLLNGSTIGLVAVGRVGRMLLRYLAPFDVRVKVYDPFLADDAARALGVEKVPDLVSLMAACDAVSLHAPVLPSTRAMIGDPELAALRDGALLVNSARSWLLDPEAFRREITSGRIRAYLDVFDREPLETDNYLRSLDNVVLTPHIAGTTDAMFERCGRFSIEALRAALT